MPEITQKLQEDMDTADQFKDDLVPLALEYYLNVIESEDPEDDDSQGDGGDDSDDDKLGESNVQGKMQSQTRSFANLSSINY